MKLQDKIKQLAELAVKIGVNVLPGDTVEVNVPVERADLARELTAEAYKAGAHKVKIVGAQVVDFVIMLHVKTSALHDFWEYQHGRDHHGEAVFYSFLHRQLGEGHLQ